MNYYKRHLGDYAKDTGHLTALEHGVYTLLLDWYYSNEAPIPEARAVRIARGNPEETETVLREFFELTAHGWVHHYADRVIAEYNAKAATNRESGKLGGRPKRTVSERLANQTLATSHKPVTIKEQKLKATVQPAAGLIRFQDFWDVYPEKQKRKDAEKIWVKQKLDAVADDLIAHVWMMRNNDDAWLRGFIPGGAVYLNQARWQDQPRQATRGPVAAPSKTFTAMQALEGMKTNGLDHTGTFDGLSDAGLLELGSPASGGRTPGNGTGLGQGG